MPGRTTILMMCGLLAAIGESPIRAQAGGLVHGEALALARLTEVRSISRRFDRHIFPGFHAGETPSVIYQPGGWAIAAGFPEPPEGFEPMPGTKDGERQVYRLSREGSFTAPGRSPAVIAGRWSVVSRFDAPLVIPPRGYLGRPGVEEAVARFLGDAFMIHLMEARGLSSPYPTGIPIYPDSAELTALTAVEHRLLLETARMINLNENTYPVFQSLARQIVAVERERRALIGEAASALETAVGLTYGLGDLVEQSIHKMAVQGGFITRPIFEDDPTYQKHQNSLLLRLMSTNYSMSHTPDNPASTVDQIAARTRVLGFLLNRIDARLGWKGLEERWRDLAVEGKQDLIEILAAADEQKEEINWGELLQQAKEEQGYNAFLRLAREDLVRLVLDREVLLGEIFPPGGGLEVRLGEQEIKLENDMASTIHMGKGRSLHTGLLSISAPGLNLSLEQYPPSPEPRVMTLLDPASGRVTGLRIRLEGLETSLGGRPLDRSSEAAPAAEKPFLVDGPGLRLEARRGQLLPADDGGLILSLDP